MRENIKLRSLGTHNGRFHADELSACALLLHYNLIDRDKIIRSRDQEQLESCEYICDVGGIYDPQNKRFDHHQSSYEGVLSSAGMVLLYLKEQQVIDAATYDHLHLSLIKGVDEHDNGLYEPKEGHTVFSIVVANFSPVSYDCSSEEETAAFYEALDFVEGHLKRSLLRFNYLLQCKQEVQAAMEPQHDYLYFSRALPWIENFFQLGGEKHPAKFILMPTGDQWKLRGIPPNLQQRMQVRQPLPEEWAGLLHEELQKKSGIQGAIFCHKGRFISIWKTLDDAKQALKYLLEGKK